MITVLIVIGITYGVGFLTTFGVFAGLAINAKWERDSWQKDDYKFALYMTLLWPITWCYLVWELIRSHIR